MNDEQSLPQAHAKATLIGWLRGEINPKATGSGKQVVKVTVFCGSYYGGHRVTFWEDLATRVTEMGTGAHVYVEGRLQHKSYKKDGIDVWTDEITATELRLIEAAPEAEVPGF